MNSSSDFDAFYRAELLPILTALETRRRALCRSLGLWAGVGVALAVAAVLAFRAPAALLVAAAALAVGGGLVWRWTTADFVRQFKAGVIAPLVRLYGPALRYDAAGHVSQARFEDSGIFRQRIDRFRGEDAVAGRVGETALEFSELHAEYKTETRDSKGRRHTHWHTIFKGLFFVADFNKHFAGRTVVLPDVAQRALGRLGQKLQELNCCRDPLVKLEDPEFEKEFVVYGTDQIEARYILSPALMRRLLEFKRRSGCPLAVSFVNSAVFLAITTGRDFFEPSVFRTLLDPARARQYAEDLRFALGLVDELNLNTRIWTK